jgi:adenylate kinase
MDVVLFGPPGAGKGTQAKRLTGFLGVPQVSTGDLMRAERASGSDLGKRFDEFMSKGLLVPDAMVLELVERRLRADDARSGCLFDGYPRTIPQAEALDGLLGRLGRGLDAVVSIEVGLEELVERIAGRRTCLSCGQVYHVRYNPPPTAGRCGNCGSDQLVQRKDDSEAIVRKRYQEYEANTAPLLGYYGTKGLVKSVDGRGALDEVTARIMNALGRGA